LSNYPTDLLTSPPQDLEASLVAPLPPLPATDAVRASPLHLVASRSGLRGGTFAESCQCKCRNAPKQASNSTRAAAQ
jgi:hypothetical protein